MSAANGEMPDQTFDVIDIGCCCRDVLGCSRIVPNGDPIFGWPALLLGGIAGAGGAF